jgi:hypothetical protein
MLSCVYAVIIITKLGTEPRGRKCVGTGPSEENAILFSPT